MAEFTIATKSGALFYVVVMMTTSGAERKLFVSTLNGIWLLVWSIWLVLVVVVAVPFTAV